MNKVCIDHPNQNGGKICKVTDVSGTWFEIYLGGKLIEKIWITSDWDAYPIDEANSLIRKEKIGQMLAMFENEK